MRIINLLEDYLGAIWLEDLLQYTPQQLRERVPNLGEKSLRLILESLQALGVILKRMPRETRSAPPVVALPCSRPTDPGFSDCRS